MQRVHLLDPEADDPVLNEVAAHHSLGHARLPRLVHHVAAVLEVRRHERDERVESHLEFGTPALRMTNADSASPVEAATALNALDAPHADAAMAAPLLQY